MWLIVFCASILFSKCLTDYTEVQKQRDALFQKEQQLMLGNDLTLSDNEHLFNDYIMNLKSAAIDHGIKDPANFNISRHFFEYKDEVKETELYRYLKEMPKGAVLHIHDTGMLGPDYVLNLTYSNNLYVCFYDDDDIKFLFAKELPAKDCVTQWQLMRDARYSSGNVKLFDEKLRKHFTIYTKDYHKKYTHINAVWSKFQNYFIETYGIFFYKPIFEQYFYDALKLFREENVMYIEVRSVLAPIYDLEGNEYDEIDTAESYHKVLQQFKNDYPDFYGAKLIYAPLRFCDSKTIQDYIDKAKIMKNKLPDFFAGFDLVGQEDSGGLIKDHLKELSQASHELNYFFHAGETNWNGCASDENLFDVIALGPKRIGHAFALVKHPVLLEEVAKKNIAIEVNVISNNVLKLVEDIRNHPVAIFLAEGLPVVLSSDDPGVWEADLITHDFYITFVGIANKHADLKLLKKLALNSLYYSSYDCNHCIVHEFEIRWTRFIDSQITRLRNNV